MPPLPGKRRRVGVSELRKKTGKGNIVDPGMRTHRHGMRTRRHAMRTHMLGMAVGSESDLQDGSLVPPSPSLTSCCVLL